MSAPVTFLDGRVTLYLGDCREVIATLPDASVDSVVTDPPYSLVSIAKRFATVTAKDVEVARANPHRRTSGGFMGKAWDTGEVAFDPAFWAEVLRVLKPGGHMVAFSGTRTYHRMVCAIEDAGFEIRDQIGWVFGSGFPKSHDVSKGIDKAGGDALAWQAFSIAYAASVKASHYNHSDIDRALGVKSSSCYWARRDHRGGMPPRHHWAKVRELLNLSADFERLYEEAEREITRVGIPKGKSRGIYGNFAETEYNYTAPATPEAARWQGWGTALKPAWESICLARKPLAEGTVAAQVLATGTGAINIDACRVASDDNRARMNNARTDGTSYVVQREAKFINPGGNGRWPANLVHDGSEEVLAAFPETSSGMLRAEVQRGSFGRNGIYGKSERDGDGRAYDGDSGSAARFFYSAKADSDDRIGSKHPTVKPVDLMRWLCRLVTPKGGTILDPFAGTGTTGEAAFYEGFTAILVEREAEYVADIERRMRLVMAGPDERARESIKARQNGKPQDDGPLFAWQAGL